MTLELLDQYKQNLQNKRPENEKKTIPIKIKNENIPSLKIQKEKNDDSTEKSDSRKIKCPNNHKLSWSSSKHNCFLCNRYENGNECYSCGYYICSTCLQIKQKPNATTKCPNDHTLTWTSSKHTCFLCASYGSGNECYSCSYYVCSKCVGIKDNLNVRNKCPNNHKLTWTNSKHNCFLCNKHENGTECYSCSYYICSDCSGTRKRTNSKIQCPNGHSLTWTSSKHNCFLCNRSENGNECYSCSYYVCSQCCGLK